ncbi:MAG: peptide-methionine (R)-S-oxide reductase MsrB [Acidimicrobiales bacterium]|nr:peptide-methionine (R)-S-oxide reductase MsrB [Acidimicrobiales bacterium]
MADNTTDDTTDDTTDTVSPIAVDEDELRARLTPEQFEVARRAGTERAFSGAYWDTKEPGTYRCVVCDLELFRSDTKYDSGSGWPSFWEPISPDRVTLHTDTSHGMTRTEARCARCDSHLGHVFPDGPRPTGDRFCMNSASLALEPDEH